MEKIEISYNLETQKNEKKEEQVNRDSNKKSIQFFAIIMFILTIIASFGILLAMNYLISYIYSNFGEITIEVFNLIYPFLTYILLIVFPILSLLITKELKNVFRVTKKKFWMQMIFVVILIALGFFISIPLGIFRLLIDSTSIYVSLDSFIIEIIYSFFLYVFFVGITEEVIFRGYIQNQLNLWIKKGKFIIPIIQGLLFGVWHIVNGDLSQVIFASLFGIGIGYFKQYFKSCSLLSTVLAHGIYDFIIIFCQLFLFYFFTV